MSTRPIINHRDLQRGDLVDLYLRISRDPEDLKLGVDRQERECRDLCKRRGWKVAAVHTDDDRSAYSGKKREGYETLLRRIRTGQVRGLVCWHPDRLHRNMDELADFIDLINASGAGVATVQGGDYDLTTASGRMTARIVGSVAQHESEHKSERIRSKMLELQRAGKFTGGGRRPYGFEYVKTSDGLHIDRLVVREDEAAIIREIVRRFVGGESLLSVIRDLNKRGVNSSTGSELGLGSVSYMLRSMRLAGLREVEGKPVSAPWSAIITPREFRQVQTLLAHNRGGTRTKRAYLLTGGLVVCGVCGKPMIGRPVGGKNGQPGIPTYGCDKGRGDHRCGSVWVRAEVVDDAVRDAVIAVVDGQGLARRLEGSGADPVLDEIERQEKRIREVEEDYATGVSKKDEYRRVRRIAESRLEELRKSYTPKPTLDYGRENPLGVAWPELPLGRKRAVLDVVMKAVRIMPVGRGATSNADRVKIDWKL
ncbi:MAG TPA: recombinase family protein [Candidatus Dormibacteraeota bacterium]|nr:recombinase family protein [Candidatus Dormibacteraeota bacterium]